MAATEDKKLTVTYLSEDNGTVPQNNCEENWSKECWESEEDRTIVRSGNADPYLISSCHSKQKETITGCENGECEPNEHPRSQQSQILASSETEDKNPIEWCPVAIIKSEKGIPTPKYDTGQGELTDDYNSEEKQLLTKEGKGSLQDYKHHEETCEIFSLVSMYSSVLHQYLFTCIPLGRTTTQE